MWLYLEDRETLLESSTSKSSFFLTYRNGKKMSSSVDVNTSAPLDVTMKAWVREDRCVKM